MSASNSKSVSVYTADYRGLQYNPRVSKSTISEPKITGIRLVNEKVKNCHDWFELQLAVEKSRLKTTNEFFYPEIKEFRPRTPPIEKCPLVEKNEIKVNSRRDYLDRPRLIYLKGPDESPQTSKLTTNDLQSSKDSLPTWWSRFPPGGCQSPQVCQDPVTKPPTCNCPQSCCSRTVCSGTNPMCICAIPCTHPTGNSLICNACLCYKLPESEKISDYYCPRTHSDSPTCPHCKHILPEEQDYKPHTVERTKMLMKPTKELIKQMQLAMPLPITLQNVAKSYAPLFQKVGRNISVHPVPPSGEVEKPQARSDNLSMAVGHGKKGGGARGKIGGNRCNCAMRPCFPMSKSRDKF